jgi:hypothetical protein
MEAVAQQGLEHGPHPVPEDGVPTADDEVGDEPRPGQELRRRAVPVAQTEPVRAVAEVAPEADLERRRGADRVGRHVHPAPEQPIAQVLGEIGGVDVDRIGEAGASSDEGAPELKTTW